VLYREKTKKRYLKFGNLVLLKGDRTFSACFRLWSLYASHFSFTTGMGSIQRNELLVITNLGTFNPFG